METLDRRTVQDLGGGPPPGRRLVLDPVGLELGPPGSDADRLLVERYGRTLRRYFQRRELSPEDAEDLTQETLIRVFRAEAQFSSRSELEAWLFEIARNVALNRVRERTALKRSAVVVSLDETAAPGDDAQNMAPRREPESEEPDALARLLQDERFERLAAALDELPPQMRQCVRLRVDQGRKIEEIATLLNISPNTVKSHLHHAKPRLRALLEDYFGAFDL